MREAIRHAEVCVSSRTPSHQVVAREIPASGFLFFLRRGKRRHINQQRQRQQKQTFMPRLRIKPAGKHQHKQRAYCDAKSAHPIPQFNRRFLRFPARLEIPSRTRTKKTSSSSHSMIAPFKRGLNTQRADASDQSIIKTQSTGGPGQQCRRRIQTRRPELRK